MATGGPGSARGPLPDRDRRRDRHRLVGASRDRRPDHRRRLRTRLDWQLTWPAADRPLWTFPRWAWRRQRLPAGQVVPLPHTRMSGTVAGRPFDGFGNVAHIYGHGNAQ